MYIMFKETTRLYTIFAFCSVCMESISITSIVRITCNNWKTKPIQGCVGTFILPNVVLTTSYCAENCQSIGNVPIVKSYIHPHYKNYVHGNNFIARNDIALVVTPRDGRMRKLVQLSALDTLSTVGLKALIPVMDEEKPRLKVTLIERCYKEQPFGYYVCSNNKLTKQSIKVCHERQEQGVPLILDDRIFGIMGITDKDSCKLPQRSFTAIGPALYWISTTAKMLGYNSDTLNMLPDKTITLVPATVKTSITTTRALATTSISPPETIAYFITTTPTPSVTPIHTHSEHHRDIHESTLPQNNIVFEDREKIKEEETLRFKNSYYVGNVQQIARKPIDLLIKKQVVKKSIDNPKIHYDLKTLKDSYVPLLRHGNFTTISTSIPTTTEDHETAITFIPAPTSSTRATRTSRPTTISTQKVTTITVPIFKLLADNRTTNVMDWFNENVKNKLKNNPSMYFVFSSSTTTVRPINFLDLT